MLYKITIINGDEIQEEVCVCKNKNIIKSKIKELKQQNEKVEYKLLDNN